MGRLSTVYHLCSRWLRAIELEEVFYRLQERLFPWPYCHCRDSRRKHAFAQANVSQEEEPVDNPLPVR